MKTMKKDSKLFVNYKFFLLSSFFLISCQVIPDQYKEILTRRTWVSYEHIETSSGSDYIMYTQKFLDDGTYSISINHPSTTYEDSEYYSEYYYSVGYQAPKYAIVLYNIEIDDEKKDMYYTAGTPIYFYFDFENGLLVTSSNANMTLPRKWEGWSSE